MQALIEKIQGCLPIVWPLQQFVATNPLWDKIASPLAEVTETMPLPTHLKTTLSLEEYYALYRQGQISQEALEKAAGSKKRAQAIVLQMDQSDQVASCGMRPIKPNAILLSKQARPFHFDDPLQQIEQQCLDWLLQFSQSRDGQVTFERWQTLMRQKNALWRELLPKKTLLQQIEALLKRLQVPKSKWESYLFAVAWQLKGWGGYCKWQQQFPNNPYCFQPLRLAEILCLWLAYEAHWCAKHPRVMTKLKPEFSLPDALASDSSAWVWQRAYELTYSQPLKQQLVAAKKDTSKKSTAAQAQWVFCIDVRSEGFRRHLEKVGPNQTLGFAGFFGVVFDLLTGETAEHTCQCPALMAPEKVVAVQTRLAPLTEQIASAVTGGIAKAKSARLAPFALYEIVGSWFALALCWKNALKPQKRLNLTSKLTQVTLGEDWSLKDKTQAAETFLRGVGLTEQFSPWVMVCGHAATSENNPYHAGLECGACGGNAGVSNAVVICQILNEPLVRAALLKKGIGIPDATHFIAASHNTTTDEIQWLDCLSKLSSAQREALELLKQQAKIAGDGNRLERLQQLPGDQNVERRAQHWAEMVPEWGLGNNACMIIGDRTLSQELDLERRAFLHSYDRTADKTGAILESIFLGPVVVGHWINIQYYLSTVDPVQLGSGNKACQNVVPSIGVMEGNQSDLKIGLPKQSLFFRGERMHQPLRLTVFIDAPKTRVQAVIDKHPHLKQLVEGEWLFIETL